MCAVLHTDSLKEMYVQYQHCYTICQDNILNIIDLKGWVTDNGSHRVLLCLYPLNHCPDGHKAMANSETQNAI